jgi:septation ring formation regulator EzrA
MNKSDAITLDYLDKKLDRAFKAQTDEILGMLSTVVGQVDERFNKLEDKFGGLEDKFTIHDIKSEARFDKIETKLDKLQDDMSSVLNRLDSIEKDISLNDDERQVMGMQLNRIHDWIEKTAKKVGVEFVH